jgi:hypothetical protein
VELHIIPNSCAIALSRTHQRIGTNPDVRHRPIDLSSRCSSLSSGVMALDSKGTEGRARALFKTAQFPRHSSYGSAEICG